MSEDLILGVDPGTIATGYALLQIGRPHKVIDFGCIRPPKSEALPKRYHILFKSIEALIEKYKPKVLSVETQFVGKNVQSALKLGMARGVIVLAASLHQMEIFEYAPTRVKKAVVGNGRASKEQIGKMLQMLLQLKELPAPEDAADALALAVCHAHQKRGVYV